VKAVTRIVILNGHSVLNTGDAAIMQVQVGLLREVLDEPRIVATSRTAAQDRGFYGRLGVRVLPPLFATPSVFGSPWRKFTGCARDLLSVATKRRLLAELRRADLVISSGGGYFFSARRHVPGPMFAQAWLHCAVAQRLGKPLLFAPQSFGPFTNRRAARALAGLLSHPTTTRVMAREEVSMALALDLLAASGAVDRACLCPDLALLFDPSDAFRQGPAQTGRPAPILAVTARDWLFPASRDRGERRIARRGYLDKLREVCVQFHHRWGGSILLYAQSRGPGHLEDDRAISAELANALRDHLPSTHVDHVDLAEDASVAEVASVLARADLLLATRFHSAILAMAIGRPVIVLGYQPKSVGMMRMLGLERFCLAMDSFEPPHLTSLVDELLADPAAIVSETIRPAITDARRHIRAAMGEALAPFAAA